MSMAGFVPLAVVTLILAAVGGTTYVVGAEANHASAAAQTIARVEQGQEFAGADTDRFAASIEDLTAVLAQPPAAGTTLSYVVNDEGSSYVLAAALPNGEVLFGSDTHVRGDYVKCESFTADCISKVTGDPSLIAAAPNWVTF